MIHGQHILLIPKAIVPELSPVFSGFGPNPMSFMSTSSGSPKGHLPRLLDHLPIQVGLRLEMCLDNHD